MEIAQWNKDFGYVMIALKFMMWPEGNWPLQNYNIFAALRTSAMLTMMLTMLTLLCAEISLSRNTTDKALDITLLIFCTILAISKTSFYRIHAADLVQNFESALKDHEATIIEEERTIMRRHGFLAKMTIVGSMFFMYFDMLVYMLVPLLADGALVNDTGQYNYQKYPVPVDYTMALLKLPENLYILIFLMMCLSILLNATGNIGSDCLFYAITIHLCGQVEVLKVRFRKLVETDANKQDSFKALTSRHQYLLKMATKLAGVISNILIVQLCLSTILICIIGCQLILALKVKDFVMITKSGMVLIIFMVQLISYSYVGDYLKSQMEDLGYSIFCSAWYKFPSGLTKDIAFVIMRTQRPMEIKAGKFFVVTMETYMSILKTSMSYLSVLRVMVND